MYVMCQCSSTDRLPLGSSSFCTILYHVERLHNNKMQLKIIRRSWRGLWYCPCNSLQALGKTITHFIWDSQCLGRGSILTLRFFTSHKSELIHIVDLLQRQTATAWSGVSAVKLSFSCISFKQVILCFLGAFTELWKETTESSCRSVCPSVLPHGTTRLPLDGFSWNLIFEYFSKISCGNSSFSEIWQE
jgi:hypothetical protein